MPQAILDYLPLTIKFLQHWNDVESALGKAVVLEDGTTRDALEDLKATLTTTQSTMTTTENDRQGAMQQRDRARAEALPIARQARKGILGTISTADEARQLPGKIPTVTQDAQTQLVALRDVENVWQRLNALPANRYPSLTTPYTVLVDMHGTEETITLARYSAAITRLDTAATALKVAEQALTQAQQDRKKAIEALKRVFLAYRKLIRGIFPRTSALYKSLP